MGRWWNHTFRLVLVLHVPAHVNVNVLTNKQTHATHAAGEECGSRSEEEEVKTTTRSTRPSQSSSSQRSILRKYCRIYSHLLKKKFVCTDSSHRGKGLAKQLFMNAIAVMQQHENSNSNYKMFCSLLHAAPALMNVYERSAGYRDVDSCW